MSKQNPLILLSLEQKSVSIPNKSLEFTLRSMRFAAHFHAIEALAIYTDYGTLAYKGMRVYLVDKLEDGACLTLLGKHEEHLNLVA